MWEGEGEGEGRRLWFVKRFDLQPLHLFTLSSFSLYYLLWICQLVNVIQKLHIANKKSIYCTAQDQTNNQMETDALRVVNLGFKSTE